MTKCGEGESHAATFLFFAMRCGTAAMIVAQVIDLMACARERAKKLSMRRDFSSKILTATQSPQRKALCQTRPTHQPRHG
jgi:hypothetical protein